MLFFYEKVKLNRSRGNPTFQQRCEANLAGIDDKVKRIIKDTVKSQSIKTEALSFDISNLTNTNDFSAFGNLNNDNRVIFLPPPPNQFPSKRMRQQQENAIDLRSPTESNRKKKSHFKGQFQNFKPINQNLQPNNQSFQPNNPAQLQQFSPDMASRSQGVLISLKYF